MTDVKWQDPPPKRNSSGWAAIAEQLRAHPGRWALVGEGVQYATYAQTIQRKPDIEVSTRRRDDGTFDVYARAVA